LTIRIVKRLIETPSKSSGKEVYQMRDMTFADRASGAAKASRRTREWNVDEAWRAYCDDVWMADYAMAADPLNVTYSSIERCRSALLACNAHLDELARLIAQRDGYDEAQSIGPDVAQ
jgi:hypothetical protein